MLSPTTSPRASHDTPNHRHGVASPARHDSNAPAAGRSESFHCSSTWPCSLTQWHGETTSSAQASDTRSASLDATASNRGGIGGRPRGEAEAGG
uniref:Uncharacterized protein n=1 Tax=Arundo donax TaxID=35708 RepID=A0A0A9H1S4_ARUDO